MSFPLLKEDGRTATLCEAICNLGHKSSLPETVAPKNLACKLDAANPDHFVGYSFKRNLVPLSPEERSLLLILAVRAVHWGDVPASSARLISRAAFPQSRKPLRRRPHVTPDFGENWVLGYP